MKIKLIKDIKPFEKFWINGDLHTKDVRNGEEIIIRIVDQRIIMGVQPDQPVEIYKGLRL